ncbi:hypothetical protein VTO73DRAFT_3721 [Trametes versicolor]
MPHPTPPTIVHLLESVRDEGAYAIVVSNSLEIILFGIYSIFFTFALMILTLYKRPLPVDWFMVSATCIMFGICMTHCSLVTTDRYSTLGSMHALPTGPQMSGLLRGADALLKTASFLSQLIMIHRCWAVWDRAWAVVYAPAIMAFAAYVCAMNGPASFPASKFRSPFVAPRNLPYDMAFCVLSLAVYTLVTALIVYRLRRMSAPVRSVKTVEELFCSLVRGMIETGGLLAVAQLFVLIFLVLGHPALVIIESIAAQIYGIGPTVMIIRLGMSALPERRLRETSPLQFSSVLIGTMTGTSDFHDDIEFADVSSESHDGAPLTPTHLKSSLRPS